MSASDSHRHPVEKLAEEFAVTGKHLHPDASGRLWVTAAEKDLPADPHRFLGAVRLWDAATGEP